jgi:hypothetical protein
LFQQADTLRGNALRAESIKINAQLNSVLAEIRRLKPLTAKGANEQETALTGSAEADPSLRRLYILTRQRALHQARGA